MQLASTVNVDGVAEAVGFQQVRVALLRGDAQGRPVAVVLCYTGRLEDQELAAVHTFAHRLDIVRQRVREARGMEPDANPCMAFLCQDDRTKSRLFEARRKQHRQVQAGRHATVENSLRGPNLLAVRAKRRRRFGVLQTLCCNRAVQRRDLLPDDVATLRLVAVHGEFAVHRSQEF